MHVNFLARVIQSVLLHTESGKAAGIPPNITVGVK